MSDSYEPAPTDAIVVVDGVEQVKHRGRMVLADKKVHMSIQITAKERHLWMLEATLQGKTMSEVVRESFNALIDARTAARERREADGD